MVGQAAYVIGQFGNAYRVAEAMTLAGKKISASAVYRWTYPKEKYGTGGVIPTSSWPYIFKAAQLYGVVLEEQKMRVSNNETTTYLQDRY